MWEVIKAIGSQVKSDRHKVLGGWIVRTFESNEYGSAEQRTFVSDPNHKWKVCVNESFKPVTGHLKKGNIKNGKYLLSNR